MLELDSVDAGGGWLVFALPPAELGAHPAAEAGRHELYFMCDDIDATVSALEQRGVEITSPITAEGFGLMTSFRIPGAGDVGLYEPRHPTALAGRNEQTR